MTNLKEVCDGTIVALSHISANHCDDDLRALEEMIVVGDAIRCVIQELSANVRMMAEIQELLADG